MEPIQHSTSWWTAPEPQHSREAFASVLASQLPRMLSDKRVDQLVGQVRADSFAPGYDKGSRVTGRRSVFPSGTSGWTAR